MVKLIQSAYSISSITICYALIYFVSRIDGNFYRRWRTRLMWQIAEHSGSYNHRQHETRSKWNWSIFEKVHYEFGSLPVSWHAESFSSAVLWLMNHQNNIKTILSVSYLQNLIQLSSLRHSFLAPIQHSEQVRIEVSRANFPFVFPSHTQIYINLSFQNDPINFNVKRTNVGSHSFSTTFERPFFFVFLDGIANANATEQKMC